MTMSSLFQFPRSQGPLNITGMSLGRRIQQARIAVGKVNRAAFARECGVTYQALWMWEQDKEVPTIGNLQKVARAAATKVSWLLEEEAPGLSREEEEFLKMVRAVDPRFSAAVHTALEGFLKASTGPHLAPGAGSGSARGKRRAK